MTKKKKNLDNRQISLFEVIQRFQNCNASNGQGGSMNIDRVFREAISEALRQSPLSRYQVAARMSELTECDITKTMLDSWTAESKDQHRFPAIFLPAFCEATACNAPLQMLGKLVGVFVLPGPEALRAEIHKIEEEISRQQNERRKRMLFLKEMEGGAR
jgi:hypothetical protein